MTEYQHLHYHRQRQSTERKAEILEIFKYILEITNDYKKDNPLNELDKEDISYKSTDGIVWSEVSGDLKKASFIFDFFSSFIPIILSIMFKINSLAFFSFTSSMLSTEGISPNG